MLRKIGIPLVALAGILFSIFMIYRGRQNPPIPPILFQPAISPYKDHIAAEGIIESVYKNIEIGSSFGDLITEIYVKVGDTVKKYDPLFKTDIRRLEALLKEAEENLKLALLDYENKKIDFTYYEKLCDKTAVSKQAYNDAEYNKKKAAQQVQIAKAQVNVISADINRSIIRAPIEGQVLQINIRIGQYANVNPYDQKPLILFGDTNYYHLRISIDEEEAWRYTNGAPATAFIRGNSSIVIPLEYQYTEPYILPKEVLTGDNTQRVDTRVLQVVYRFSKSNYPVYVGQLLDVFIQAQPHQVNHAKR